MAAHPHRGPRTGRHGPALTSHQTRLLRAIQWGLTGVGIFCLVGAAVVIALTPEAWPL